MITIKSNINPSSLEYKLKNTIKDVKKVKIEAGFIDGAKYPDGTPVATVAMQNNLGTANIPARPFFTIAINKNKKKWIKLLKNGIIQGKGLKAAKLVGEQMRVDIVKTITDLDTPPNAPYTIAKKGSSNPLVDTSTLRKSVTYKIIKR